MLYSCDYCDTKEIELWDDLLTIVEVDGGYTFKGILRSRKFLPEDKWKTMPLFTKEEAEKFRKAVLEPPIMQ